MDSLTHNHGYVKKLKVINQTRAYLHHLKTNR